METKHEDAYQFFTEAIAERDRLKEENEKEKQNSKYWEGQATLSRELAANRQWHVDSLKEENERLKEKPFYEQFVNAFEVNQKLISDRDSLKQLNSELLEALEECMKADQGGTRLERDQSFKKAKSAIYKAKSQ